MQHCSSPRDAQASKTPGSASRSGPSRRCRANWPSADRPTVSPAAPASWHRTGTAATLPGTVQQPTSDPNGRSSYEAGPHRNGRSVLSHPSGNRTGKAHRVGDLAAAAESVAWCAGEAGVMVGLVASSQRSAAPAHWRFSMSQDDFPAPQTGFVVTHFLVVSDQDRSREFYRSVFGATVLLERDPDILRLANIWLILNAGGGPTDDKPTVTLTTPPDPNLTSAFLNVRVADIARAYREWSARGATFLTEPKDHGREIRAYIRDPDGHLIEVGQSTVWRG